MPEIVLLEPNFPAELLEQISAQVCLDVENQTAIANSGSSILPKLALK